MTNFGFKVRKWDLEMRSTLPLFNLGPLIVLGFAFFIPCTNAKEKAITMELVG